MPEQTKENRRAYKRDNYRASQEAKKQARQESTQENPQESQGGPRNDLKRKPDRDLAPATQVVQAPRKKRKPAAYIDPEAQPQGHARESSAVQSDMEPKEAAGTPRRWWRHQWRWRWTTAKATCAHVFFKLRQVARTLT